MLSVARAPTESTISVLVSRDWRSKKDILTFDVYRLEHMVSSHEMNNNADSVNGTAALKFYLKSIDFCKDTRFVKGNKNNAAGRA